MFRMVLDDYRSQAKQAFKDTWKTGNWVIYMYMMVYPPLFIHFNIDEYFVYYAMILPMILGVLLSRMYPNKLGKTLFLCPMTEKEKREYLETGFWIRVFLPSILYVVAGILLTIKGILKPFYFVAYAIAIFCFLVSVNIYRQPKGLKETNLMSEVKVYDLPGHFGFWSVAAQVAGMCGVFWVTAIIVDSDATLDNIELVGVILIFAAIIFICIKMVVSYYKPVMEGAIYYEGLPRKDGKK